MKVIGITGGVGSGKSRVLAYLEDTYDAVVCQADHVAWELQKQGTDCYREIVTCFGNGILKADLPNAAIDRAKLGQIVFSDKKQLAKLNAIMHPAVKSEIKNRIGQKAKQGTELFVLEAALLIEEDYGEICDELWYIYAEEKTRRERLKKERGYDDKKIADMIAAQLSEDAYRDACDITIDNTGEFSYTVQQISQKLCCGGYTYESTKSKQ